MPMVSDLREVIDALQSEVEFEAAVTELGAVGIDRTRRSFLPQEEIAASCAGAVGCDVKQLNEAGRARSVSGLAAEKSRP
jgi:hypothetical protein